MTTTRKSPYQRLVEIGSSFAWDVLSRRKIRMETLELNNSPVLHSLYHRAIAAEQLDYEVILEARDGKIELIYRQKIKLVNVPYEFLP
jgi:hypothetical protein